MGKNDFLTPKAIANQIKAKGLQKLRWYCQMCQKQCRDENGFKCHCMSESHQRQMQIFGQNPHRIVDGYSKEFEQAFLDLMRRSYRFRRDTANAIYKECIRDGHHIHMNSTRWASLTEFVEYLGSTGKCKVDETPKGLFITYIDRDSETLFKEKMKNKRLRAEVVEEEKQEREIKKQIERAEQLVSLNSEREKEKPSLDKELNLKSGVKVGFSLGSKKDKERERGESSRLVFDDGESEKTEKAKLGDDEVGKNSKSSLEELMLEEERKKEKINRKDYWLCEGIVVKLMSKALAEKGYYRQKGIIRKVIDKYVGEIEMLESKHVLRVDQEELERLCSLKLGAR